MKFNIDEWVGCEAMSYIQINETFFPLYYSSDEETITKLKVLNIEHFRLDIVLLFGQYSKHFLKS